jgi:hypothetical protein
MNITELSVTRVLESFVAIKKFLVKIYNNLVRTAATNLWTSCILLAPISEFVKLVLEPHLEIVTSRTLEHQNPHCTWRLVRAACQRALATGRRPCCDPGRKRLAGEDTCCLHPGLTGDEINLGILGVWMTPFTARNFHQLIKTLWSNSFPVTMFIISYGYYKILGWILQFWSVVFLPCCSLWGPGTRNRLNPCSSRITVS